MRSWGGALTWKNRCSYKKRKKHQRSLSLHTCTEERPCEDTASRWPFAIQEESSHKKPALTALDLDSGLQNCETIKFCYYNPQLWSCHGSPADQDPFFIFSNVLSFLCPMSPFMPCCHHYFSKLPLWSKPLSSSTSCIQCASSSHKNLWSTYHLHLLPTHLPLLPHFSPSLQICQPTISLTVSPMP